MKFEAEFGTGEICGYNEHARRGDKRMEDVLVKVVAIIFTADTVRYEVEHIGSYFGVQRFLVEPGALHGDPGFDQDLGCYPPDKL